MMRRKVIKQGNNTLTLTLPRKWTLKCGVKPGSELDVQEQGSNLVVSNVAQVQNEDSITVDVSNLDRTSIGTLVQGLYRYGYNDITVTTGDVSTPHHRIGKPVPVSRVIHDMTSRFVGSEVLSSSSKSFSIKRITSESREEFDTVLRRVYRLLNEMIDTFNDGIEKNDINILESIEFQHINIKKFVNYSLRLLNKFGHPDAKKTAFYFTIIQYLSKIDDFVKNAARYIANNKYEMSQRATKVTKDIGNSVKMYYDLFYDYNITKVASLNECRDKIRNNFFSKVKEFSKEELVILGGLTQIIEVLLDMTELRMALEN
jgi:phosphate uptake regulator